MSDYPFLGVSVETEMIVKLPHHWGLINQQIHVTPLLICLFLEGQVIW